MTTKQPKQVLTRVHTDDYELVQIATGVPCFIDDCIRLGNGQSTRFLDGGTAPTINCPTGTIIHSNRAGVSKHSDYPAAYNLLWKKKVKLSDKQYAVLLDIFNELPEEFTRISADTKSAFFDRLYQK